MIVNAKENMSVFNFIFLSLVCFSFVGCASSRKEVTLKRAAFDLDCPVEQLDVQELSEKSMGVKGCGKKAPMSCNAVTCLI